MYAKPAASFEARHQGDKNGSIACLRQVKRSGYSKAKTFPYLLATLNSRRQAGTVAAWLNQRPVHFSGLWERLHRAVKTAPIRRRGPGCNARSSLSSTANSAPCGLAVHYPVRHHLPAYDSRRYRQTGVRKSHCVTLIDRGRYL